MRSTKTLESSLNKLFDASSGSVISTGDSVAERILDAGGLGSGGGGSIVYTNLPFNTFSLTHNNITEIQELDLTNAMGVYCYYHFYNTGTYVYENLGYVGYQILWYGGLSGHTELGTSGFWDLDNNHQGFTTNFLHVTDFSDTLDTSDIDAVKAHLIQSNFKFIRNSGIVGYDSRKPLFVVFPGSTSLQRYARIYCFFGLSPFLADINVSDIREATFNPVYESETCKLLDIEKIGLLSITCNTNATGQVPTDLPEIQAPSIRNSVPHMDFQFATPGDTVTGDFTEASFLNVLVEDYVCQRAALADGLTYSQIELSNPEQWNCLYIMGGNSEYTEAQNSDYGSKTLHPRNIKLYGSHDGLNWATLCEEEFGDEEWEKWEIKEIPLVIGDFFTYYKILFPAQDLAFMGVYWRKHNRFIQGGTVPRANGQEFLFNQTNPSGSQLSCPAWGSVSEIGKIPHDMQESSMIIWKNYNGSMGLDLGSSSLCPQTKVSVGKALIENFAEGSDPITIPQTVERDNSVIFPRGCGVSQKAGINPDNDGNTALMSNGFQPVVPGRVYTLKYYGGEVANIIDYEPKINTFIASSVFDATDFAGINSYRYWLSPRYINEYHIQLIDNPFTTFEFKFPDTYHMSRSLNTTFAASIRLEGFDGATVIFPTINWLPSAPISFSGVLNILLFWVNTGDNEYIPNGMWYQE